MQNATCPENRKNLYSKLSLSLSIYVNGYKPGKYTFWLHCSQKPKFEFGHVDFCISERAFFIPVWYPFLYSKPKHVVQSLHNFMSDHH